MTSAKELATKIKATEPAMSPEQVRAATHLIHKDALSTYCGIALGAPDSGFMSQTDFRQGTYVQKRATCIACLHWLLHLKAIKKG